MRQIIRCIHRDKAVIDKRLWDIDSDGYGTAVYRIQLQKNIYELVIFSHQILDAQRSDRVVAEAWDATFVLYDGVASPDVIATLAKHVPKQEQGRYDEKVLVLSRANKSVRLFSHVVDKLKQGEQPDATYLASIGYLMRTTAVYGNGKFGIADRCCISNRPALQAPFQCEMLAVWLFREFTLDLVESIAADKNPSQAVTLAKATRRWLGIGNSTGLGMAPFLVRHPILLNNWIMAKETALTRICQLPTTTTAQQQSIIALLQRAIVHVGEWQVEDAVQMSKIKQLREELPRLNDWLKEKLKPESKQTNFNPKQLSQQSLNFSDDCQELIVSLLIEAYPELSEDLIASMGTTNHEGNTNLLDYTLQPAMPLSELQQLIKTHCQWAFSFDFSTPEAQDKFWYVSEEKLEPRLGQRFSEDGGDKEMPIDIARQIQQLQHSLDAFRQAHPQLTTTAQFLRTHSEHRHAVLRVQNLPHYPYAEIRDNLIGAHCLPIDLLRCKLSFFGATKFDPKSDKWVRVNLFQGAPTRHEINDDNADDWWLLQSPFCPSVFH